MSNEKNIVKIQINNKTEIQKNNLSQSFCKEIYEKEDFLQEIRIIREYCKDQIMKLSTLIKEINIKIENKIETIQSNQKQLIELYVDSKLKNEIISDYPVFKSKTNEDFYNHQIKIEEIRKDIDNITYKYDKIYIDNFKFPGLVGDKESRFKNFKEYVFFLIDSIDNLKSSKIYQDNLMKQLESKFNENIKYFVKQIQNSEKICKQYTDNQKKKIENIIKDIPDEFVKKYDDIRLENNKYAIKLLNRCDDLSDLQYKLEHLSNIMEKKIDEYEEMFKKNNEEKNEKFDLILNKYSSIEEMVYSMNEFFLKKQSFEDHCYEQIELMNSEIINMKNIINNDINSNNKDNNEGNDKNNQKKIHNNVDSVTKLDLINLKQNFEKQFIKIEENLEKNLKEIRKEKIFLEEKLDKKIVDFNTQIKQILSLKDKTINNILEKNTLIDKTLYEYKKMFKEFNSKILGIDNLINEKKTIKDEIEKIKKENSYINSTLKKFDNSFIQFSHDYKELDQIINGILEREKKKKINYSNIRKPNEHFSLYNSYASQTSRDYLNPNNIQKQNFFNLMSMEKSKEENNKSIKLKPNKTYMEAKNKKNIQNNSSSPKLNNSHSLSKLKDETFSSKQKRLKLYSLKEIIQKLPYYSVKDIDIEEKNKNLFENNISKKI